MGAGSSQDWIVGYRDQGNLTGPRLCELESKGMANAQKVYVELNDA